MNILNVAEKNDAAKEIARILSRGSLQRREGRSKFNKIYEFNYSLPNMNCNMIMTSVSGHLLELRFPVEMKNWNTVNMTTLFDSPVNKVCSESSKNVKVTLEEQARKCQKLIIWTDCDREGENIGMEIVEVCLAVNSRLDVKRAKFSEITYQSVTRALNNLTEMDRKQVNAVDVRQELDLKTGAAFTRLQTLRLTKAFPSTLTGQIISYGSCQFPTLGFVVERYKNVENFQPEPFWKINLIHKKQNQSVEFNWNRIKLFDRNAVVSLFDNITTDGGTLACVLDIASRPKSKFRPVALDTVELEKLASRKLKIRAKEAMNIAEKLYSKGYISYPRTETNIFPKEINLTTLVEKQVSDNRWNDFAKRLIERGPNPRNGKKTDQAHPPIHPLKCGDGLTGKDAQLFELVVRHFLACLSQNAEGHETKVTVECISQDLGLQAWPTSDNNRRSASDLGEIFTVTGLTVVERNYLEVYIYEKWSDKELPVFELGEIFSPDSISIESGSTLPPKLLTEADLITLMDKHGIGTDATHSEHIEKIRSRQYIGSTGADEKFLVPSMLGMGLVEAYDSMGYYLSQPNMRAEFERELVKICQGCKEPNEVLTFYIRTYKEIFDNVVRQIRKLDDGVGIFLGEQPSMTGEVGNINTVGTFEQQSGLAPPVCSCPRCSSGSIRVRHTSRGWMLGCTNYPNCIYSKWFSSDIAHIAVASNSVCSNVAAHHRSALPVYKLAVKMVGNATAVLGREIRNSNGEFVVCVYCDKEACDSLDIRPICTEDSSVITTASSLIVAADGDNEIISNPSLPSTISVNPLSTNSSNQSLALPHAMVLPIVQRQVLPSEGFGDESIPNCHCGQQSTKKKVFKENKNKGRFFYTCTESKCSFFSWADTPNRSQSFDTGLGSSISSRFNDTGYSNSLQSMSNISTSSSVDCRCGKPAKPFTVKKETANKGRKFYNCSECNFFQWADEAGLSKPSTSGGGGHSYGRRNESNANTSNFRKRTSTDVSSDFGGNLMPGEQRCFTSPENMWPPVNKRGRFSVIRNKKVRYCSSCRMPGHTSNKCPQKF